MFNTLYESEAFIEWQMMPAQIASGFAKLYVNSASMTLTESARLHPWRAIGEVTLPTAAARGRTPYTSASRTRFPASLGRIFPHPPAHMEQLPVGLIGDEI